MNCSSKETWRSRNPDKIFEYHRRQKGKAYYKKYRRKYNENWNKKNPDKLRAHEVFRYAVKKGKATRKNICEICGQIGHIHAHHEDYNKPLKVKFVCPRCHIKIHPVEVK